MRTRCWSFPMRGFRSTWLVTWVLVLSLWIGLTRGMRESQVRELRQETEHMFYHGFENYMQNAFPEDELRPLTCGPLSRNRENPADAALNDVLGNYSLTLIDTLSTLAIMSSSPDSGDKAWGYFQDGIIDFVRLYGDGSKGPAGQGERQRGFDMDSKVQVFETVIRGLGGLLSTHLFAVGDLPIRGYQPPEKEAAFAKAWNKSSFPKGSHGIRWKDGFIYDGQFLRLAVDLADRILPAFYTDTGLPYPRVNLRYGVQKHPYYAKSPLNVGLCDDSNNLFCGGPSQSYEETTETCSAGAGSLVLEFTVLSRLTGDGRYEDLGKRAFWAVWARRSDIGLIGSGIDVETGRWMHPYTGIGAGIDSFFEYAFKSYILLSAGERQPYNKKSPWHVMDHRIPPLTEYEHSPEAFLQVWNESHASIMRHLYRGSGFQHPHLIQGDVFTGATRAFWFDSLSCFYPGLLSMVGELDEAITIHLLPTAVWNRYSGLPERWNVATGHVEAGLGWNGGRPEFTESTYYIYLATKDPWYLHVGEMVLRDLKRRCWTACGWAGLQDVRTGEMTNRMESFFLGETAQYLYMLFDTEHPLNKIDKPYVFSTEGHPLIIPDKPETGASTRSRSPKKQKKPDPQLSRQTCPAAAPAGKFGVSSTAGRPDVFHAASLARLHLLPNRGNPEGPLREYARDHPSTSLSDLSSPTNYTYYPWTLPAELVPFDATSSPIMIRPTLDISFPTLPGMIMGPGSFERVRDGILVKTIGGLRLSMVQDVALTDAGGSGSGGRGDEEGYRIQVLNNVPLGKDEKVYLSRDVTFDVLDPTDPNFTRTRDSSMVDIVIDVIPALLGQRNESDVDQESTAEAPGQEYSDYDDGNDYDGGDDDDFVEPPAASGMKTVFSSLMNSVSALLRDEMHGHFAWTSSSSSQKKLPSLRLTLPATVSTGIGSAPLPDVEDASITSLSDDLSSHPLSWTSIYFADDICDQRLVRQIVQNHQVLVINRGGCSFSQKLRNIAAYPPSRSALKLVIIVSDDDDASAADGKGSSSSSSSSSFFSSTQAKPLGALRAEPFLVRPLLDEVQMTAGGIPRRHLISMVMVGGGRETYELLRQASGVGIKRRYMVYSQGVPISNLYIV